MFRKILVFVLLLLFASPASAAAEKTYVNGIDFGFPPFGYVDKQGSPSGFDVEAVDWIAKEMGFKVKHQPMDWDGIIPALNAGKIDFIASGMSVTDDRKKVVNFTKPYYTVTQVLVVKADEKRSLRELLKGGEKVGAQRGTPTRELLAEMKMKPGHDFELMEYDSSDLSMQDLAVGRIAASGMDSTIAKEMIKGGKYKIAGDLEAEPENYAYAARKKDADLLKMLNEGLTKLMADPYWEELKTKHDVK